MSACSPDWPLFSSEAGQAKMLAACWGGLRQLLQQHACAPHLHGQHSVHRHTDGDSSGAKIPGKSAGKWNLANRQHPSVQPELRSRIQRIITTNWLWFGFIQHLVLIFKCLVLGTAPNLTLVLNCTACLGVFKENVNSCGLDSLLFLRLSACF